MSHLITALNDENSEVRTTAAQALGALGEATAVSHLITALNDEDSWVRKTAAQALGRLNVAKSISLIAATAVTGYPSTDYVTALIHLAPDEAEKVLHGYTQRLRHGSWVERLRGQALWSLGKMDNALDNFHQALKKRENVNNLLALAHFYLEQDDLPKAQGYANHAVEKASENEICILSLAVILWQMDKITDALKKLESKRWKQPKEIQKSVIKILRYSYFWRDKAISALEEMLEKAND